MSAALAEPEQLAELERLTGDRPRCELRRPCTCCPERVHTCDDPAVARVSWTWRGRRRFVAVFCEPHAELIARTAPGAEVRQL